MARARPQRGARTAPKWSSRDVDDQVQTLHRVNLAAGGVALTSGVWRSAGATIDSAPTW
jgi:hypothetical protein